LSHSPRLRKKVGLRPTSLITPLTRRERPLRTREDAVLANPLSRSRRGILRARTSPPSTTAYRPASLNAPPEGALLSLGARPQPPSAARPSLSSGTITRTWRCLWRKDPDPENGPVDGVHLQWDAETSLSYHRARYYAPRLGRWISEDPSGGFNLFLYTGNSPTGWVDPSGLVAWECGGVTASYGGGFFVTRCVSDCVGGQKAAARYLGAVLGFGLAIGPFELEDYTNYPAGTNLEGAFALLGWGLGAGGVSADLAIVLMGAGRSTEPVHVSLQLTHLDPKTGVRLKPHVGEIAVGGATAMLDEKRYPCDCK
jgi:RHS repeat-associated protein